MSYPKFLLKEIYWSFFYDKFDSQAEFEAGITDYYQEIFNKNFGSFTKKVFEHPEIVVQYMIYEDEDNDQEEREPRVHLKADNNKFFTRGELLYKIHNAVCEDLEDEDHHYFEGLLFAGDDDIEYPNIPLYFIMLGS